MSDYTLTQINIYPIKSLGGISLQSSIVEERGLKYDRRWMLVDENNNFITQRSFPQMALLQVEIENNLLNIKHKQNKLSPLAILLQPDEEVLINVQVWKDNVTVLQYGGDVNNWFAQALGIQCKLVYMPDSTKRNVDKQYARNKIVSFADGYPLMIIGNESLKNLNSKLEEPISMNRFRPNFVFKGGTAFDEDKWKTFKIGNVVFKSVKPCARCVITTINQKTGTIGKEPLKTLSAYRQKDNKVMFGINLVSEGGGKIMIGDNIYLIS